MPRSTWTFAIANAEVAILLVRGGSAARMTGLKVDAYSAAVAMYVVMAYAVRLVKYRTATAHGQRTRQRWSNWTVVGFSKMLRHQRSDLSTFFAYAGSKSSSEGGARRPPMRGNSL